MEGGAALAEALESRGSRGQFEGAPRIDFMLEPGETRSIEMTMVAGEDAFVEALVFQDFDGADIDLTVTGPDGQVLASETGEDTGIPGFGTFVQFWPEVCLDVIVAVENNGSAAGKVTVLAPMSFRDRCEN